MKKSISFWQTVGFVFTSILGTLLHFLFDWSRQNMFAALFSAVNESIWEHMKLIYYPMLLFAWLEYRIWGRDRGQFWCIKLLGMLLGLVLIPIIFYTYTGILGVSADWFNITIFFLAAGSAFWMETHLFRNGFAYRIQPQAAVTVLLLIGLLFTILTFFPPHIPLFRDPITGGYGYF